LPSQALRALASRINYPILLHCTQGKDRTGLLIALLLFLLDIPLDAINYDYTISETELLPERELRMVEIREIGLTEEFAGTPKDWIEKMYGYLEERYGGVAAYLDGIGIGKDLQERIIEVLQG
jgi:protein-tyrosine phosphatase